MTPVRRKFYVEIAVTCLLAAALFSVGYRDDYWGLGFLVPCLVLQFWKLHQLGQAAEEA